MLSGQNQGHHSTSHDLAESIGFSSSEGVLANNLDLRRVQTHVEGFLFKLHKESLGEQIWYSYDDVKHTKSWSSYLVLFFIFIVVFSGLRVTCGYRWILQITILSSVQSTVICLANFLDFVRHQQISHLQGKIYFK